MPWRKFPAHAPVYAPATGALESRNVEGKFRRAGLRGVRGVFLNKTIRADFLIKRLNKKIEVYCLIKTLLKTPPLTTSKTTLRRRKHALSHHLARP